MTKENTDRRALRNAELDIRLMLVRFAAQPSNVISEDGEFAHRLFQGGATISRIRTVESREECGTADVISRLAPPFCCERLAVS